MNAIELASAKKQTHAIHRLLDFYASKAIRFPYFPGLPEVFENSIREGQVDLVRRLVKNFGAPVLTVISKKRMPLEIACESNQLKVRSRIDCTRLCYSNGRL
jgi:hypothetical protein